MKESERRQIAHSQHQQLAKRIEQSPLDNPVRDVLLRKLKVASSVGVATVIREFEGAMEDYRKKHLPSYRGDRSHAASPMNKQAYLLHHK